MTSFQVTTAPLSIGLASLILVLLQRAHPLPLYNLLWMVVALLATAQGLWPVYSNYVAQVASITYPQSLPLVAMIVLLVKLLYAHIINTRIGQQGCRLNQRLAVFELGHEGDKEL